jgi:hypothetical protein
LYTDNPSHSIPLPLAIRVLYKEARSISTVLIFVPVEILYLCIVIIVPLLVVTYKLSPSSSRP